jgi:hypothetical protein
LYGVGVTGVIGGEEKGIGNLSTPGSVYVVVVCV